MDKELIKKNIKLMDATIEKMIHVMSSIHNVQNWKRGLRNLDRVFQDVFLCIENM